MEEVILVDDKDKVIGFCEKLKAHEDLLLHRAFSVFIFNTQGEFLLQQRAVDKYHSGGLWTNSCCSHPKPEESTLDAGVRRLREEIGMQAGLTHFGHLLYKISFENGLGEHEYDHLMYGVSDNLPVLNPNEAKAFRYISLNDLLDEVKSNPEQFTFWFKAILQEKEQEFKAITSKIITLNLV